MTRAEIDRDLGVALTELTEALALWACEQIERLLARCLGAAALAG